MIKIREKIFPVIAISLTLAVIVISFTDSLEGKMQDVGKLNKLHIFDSPELPYVPPPYPQSRKLYTVAVLPFVPSEGFTPADAESAASLFAYHLNGAAWGIKVLERELVVSTMAGMNIAALPGGDGALELGKALGADCVILAVINAVSENAVLENAVSEHTVIDVKMIDINTAVVSTIEPLRVESLTGLFVPMQSYVKELVPFLPGSHGYYAIGDSGPGGGIIFYSFYGHYMEAKGVIGLYDWNEAMSLPENYSTDSFSGWLMPTAYELDLVYQTLKSKGLGDFLDEFYWSSSLAAPDFTFPWEQDFGSGKRAYNSSYSRESHALLFRPFTSEL